MINNSSKKGIYMANMSLCGKFIGTEELAKLPFKKIGRNIQIHERANIYGIENLTIGDNVKIDQFTSIVVTSSMEIGSHVHISPFCVISASSPIVMEDFTGLASGCKIYTGSDDYSGKALTNSTIPKKFLGGDYGPVTIKKHAILGAGTIVMPNVTIGTGAATGVYTFVNKNLDDWFVYVGIPAKKMYPRSRDLLNDETKFLEEYEES